MRREVQKIVVERKIRDRAKKVGIMAFNSGISIKKFFWLLAAFLAVFCSAGVSPVRAESGPALKNPNSKLGKIVLGYYTEDYPKDRLSYDSLNANALLIDAAAMFNYTFDENGYLSGQLTNDIKTASQKGVTCLALVHNYTGYFNGALAYNVLSSSKKRKNLEYSILYLIKKQGYKGVNIDIEGLPPAARAAYTAFLWELRQLFAPYGYILTVSVPAKTRDDPYNSWSGAYDYREIGKAADLVCIMTYDEHWPGGHPGPIASLPWVQKVLDYAIAVMPRPKILMGIPAYGYDWSAAGTKTVRWRDAKELAARYGGGGWDNYSCCPYFIYYGKDGQRHEVWYENKYSLKIKLDLAKNYGVAGIAFWRMGFEDESFWQTVVEKFKV